MFKTPNQMIQELFGFDHGSVPVESFTHPIRNQYPDLVGSSSISNTTKQNWQKADLIPIGVIIVFIVSMVSFFGYYKPAANLTKVNLNINRLSSAFDKRANQINSMANRLDQFVISNNLPRELQSAISLVRSSVDSLSENRPNEKFIAKRFAAEARFRELSASIIESRDLSLYGDLSELPEDFTDKDLVARGVKTLELVEQWSDEYSTTEEEAVDLLDVFTGKVMPKRTIELQNSILKEWQDAQASLLQNWKQLKELEITLTTRAEAIRAARQREAERERVVLERQREYELSQKSSSKVVTPRKVEKPVQATKRVSKKTRAKPTQQPRKKQNNELERRKQAASKLFD
ncbi:hypothetical protein [Arenicella xantha]|uniref:Uncharacterized protein n=1 Tax=Arenicella xantha TaxID=644221 RepID=A0A395JQ98_9GAMM|nr:hypothetical protein [Arenicella xantha]RBP53523.1 hypothetical protein DFR28_101910 [Arenicella xantha]